MIENEIFKHIPARLVESVAVTEHVHKERD